MKGKLHRPKKERKHREQRPSLLCVGKDALTNIMVHLAGTLEPGGVVGPSMVARDLASAAQVQASAAPHPCCPCMQRALHRSLWVRCYLHQLVHRFAGIDGFTAYLRDNDNDGRYSLPYLRLHSLPYLRLDSFV